jgi:Carboxypeptidase regulatory-like domain
MSTRIRSHHRAAGVLLIVLLGAIGATAQMPQLPRTRTLAVSAKVETKTGEISGRVVNENGQPLVNANVWVQLNRPDALSATGIPTNREGVFKFSGLEPGSYTVNASMPSYIPKSLSSGLVVQSADAVTLVMIKGGIISGTVTNSKGGPVVAVGIRVEMVLDESGRRTANTYESVTDDRGVYRVYGLPSGTYIVSADGSADYSPSGVNAYSTDTPTFAPSSSRETADEISVRAGDESNVDIRYRAEHGSSIRGVVRGARTGDMGFWVTLTSLAEKGQRWSSSFRDPNGEFAFEGIPDGEYHLVALAYWNDRDRGLSESMVINVRGADIEGIELTAVALASINGRVVLKELKEPVAECTDKRQTQFSEVSLIPLQRVNEGAKKKPQFVWTGQGSMTPNAQGNVTLKDLAAGEYYFGVRLPGQQWYLQSVAFVPATPGGVPTDASRTWTTVKPGDRLAGLTFTLSQGAALVRGEITLPEGQTLPDKLTVYLVPAEAAQADDALRYFAGPVNGQGNFWLSNVPPGRYWMLAQPGTEDTRYENSKIRLPDAAVTRSSLRQAAEQKKTALELKPCQDLTFRLPL